MEQGKGAGTTQSLTAKEIFDQALASKYGIEIVPDDYRTVRNVRRRLYAAREKLRASGNLEYDDLSFLIRGHEVWVIPRKRLPADKTELLDCRPLCVRELPDRILSRGKSRVGLRIS